MEKTYMVYAKRIQNNHAQETELVGIYPGETKSEAACCAMNDYSNRGIYDLNTFFAMPKRCEK